LLDLQLSNCPDTGKWPLTTNVQGDMIAPAGEVVGATTYDEEE
jgi:hypothetical protein